MPGGRPAITRSSGADECVASLSGTRTWQTHFGKFVRDKRATWPGIEKWYRADGFRLAHPEKNVEG
jgi:hypothetical protein